MTPGAGVYAGARAGSHHLIGLNGAHAHPPLGPASREEWQDLLRRADFGQLITSGLVDGYPVVVPSHFVYDGDAEIWLHLARPNPAWQPIVDDPDGKFEILTRQLARLEPKNSSREIADHLAERSGPLDQAARSQLLRRSDAED